MVPVLIVGIVIVVGAIVLVVVGVRNPMRDDESVYRPALKSSVKKASKSILNSLSFRSHLRSALFILWRGYWVNLLSGLPLKMP